MAFIVINWRPLFLIVFSDEDVYKKFDFFDASTTSLTLYVGPLVFGLFATLTSPYISNWSSWWAVKPITLRRIREVDSAHEVLKIKNKFSAERENERALIEQELINRAKRDEQINTISDPEVKEQLSAQVDRIREYLPVPTIKEVQAVRSKFAPEIIADLADLGSEERAIISGLAVNDEGIFIASFVGEKLREITFRNGEPDPVLIGNHRRANRRFVEAIQKLVRGGYITLKRDDLVIASHDIEDKTRISGSEYEITDKGYLLYDAFSAQLPF